MHGQVVPHGSHAVGRVGGPLQLAAHLPAPHAAGQFLQLHLVAIVVHGHGQVRERIGGQQQALALQLHVEQQARRNQLAGQGGGQVSFVAGRPGAAAAVAGLAAAGSGSPGERHGHGG